MGLRKLLGRNYYSISRRKLLYFHFIIPNRDAIRKKRLLGFYKKAVYNQKTITTGMGTVSIGKRCAFGFKPGGYYYSGLIELQPRYENAKIVIGNQVNTNNNLFICAANSVEIGDFTLIGEGVCIMDHEAHGIEPDKRRCLGKISSVKIGENVWIGNRVTILKNTEIGDNSIIAAGAVVSGQFSNNVIIGGIPARIIKHI